MSLFSGNPNKNKQIELQNAIFGTNEKKLMVSPEFLDNMTMQYISKRMKSINQKMELIFTTKSPKTFFVNYDAIISDLNELVAIQKYHAFKKPIPSDFKKNIESKKEKYILAMLNRVWKNANLKANFNPTLGEKRDPLTFGPVLDEILAFSDQYTSVVLGHIDRFYKSVYGYSMNEAPAPKEAADEEEAAYEEVPDDDISDEALSEKFLETEDIQLNE